MLALKKIYIYVGYVTVNLDSSFANIYVNDAIFGLPEKEMLQKHCKHGKRRWSYFQIVDEANFEGKHLPKIVSI